MKPKYLNNLIEESHSLFIRMKSGLRKAGLVALVGAIIGVGVYGCKMEEPKKEDTSPTVSVEQIEGLRLFQESPGVQQGKEICIFNLKAIGEAITKYKEDHGDLPNWLSDLYPDYIKDKQTFLCPADSSEPRGSQHAPFDFRPELHDPRIPCSYIYQFCPALGYREWKKSELSEFGDKVPMVRCWWHLGDELTEQGYPGVINLSYGGEVYESGTLWEAEVTR